MPLPELDVTMHVNLADPALHAENDLSGFWQRMRSDEPVFWNVVDGMPGGGFWAVARYADAVAVLKDPARFRSGQGNLLESLLTGGDTASGLMLPVTDGKAHSQMRKALSNRFSVRALAGLKESIGALITDLVRNALEAGKVDFASDVAAKIPLAVICDILGVPASDRELMFSFTSSALSADRPNLHAAQAAISQQEIMLYFSELLEERRSSPRDDLISELVVGGSDEARLGDDEIIMNCYSLVLGGDETTRLVMSGAVRALIEHPDQWDLLRSGEVGIPDAVEEVLRWTTPGMHVGRAAAADADLGGRRIASGDVVTVWTCSANFDEREFDQPQEFVLGRRPNRHLTFGYGPHFCLGGHLARIELAMLLEVLREQVGVIEAAGDPAPVYSNFLSGAALLPVLMTARGAR
ncbi:cytochrome P450 [Streptomyces sp. NPDC040750]|uniref:cytochrome P450 n=1 Tax=Streptomyces sp. NPDC040750 TaxID=3154491 RepID=UPI0033DDA673